MYKKDILSLIHHLVVNLSLSETYLWPYICFYIFRYGTEVGTASENALTAVGNSYLTVYNATALGPKSLAKRAAKTAGKVAVGVSDDVILGRPEAPSNGQNQEQNLTENNTNTTKKSLEEPKPDKPE